MEIRDHQEGDGEGKENAIWDCGSRLYDSYELASVVRHIERHIGSSSPPSSTPDHPVISSSTNSMEERSPPGMDNNNNVWGNLQAEEDRRRRSWFTRSSTIWRKSIRSPNSATTIAGKEEKQQQPINRLGFHGIFKSVALWKNKTKNKIDEPCI